MTDLLVRLPEPDVGPATGPAPGAEAEPRPRPHDRPAPLRMRPVAGAGAARRPASRSVGRHRLIEPEPDRRRAWGITACVAGTLAAGAVAAGAIQLPEQPGAAPDVEPVAAVAPPAELSPLETSARQVAQERTFPPPAAADPAPVSPALVTPSEPAPYTVRDGDTLESIARAHGLADWGVLVDLNRETVADPDLIHAGQVLRMP